MKMEKLGNPTFGFDLTSYEEIVKKVNNLKIRKFSQKTDIPVNRKKLGLFTKEQSAISTEKSLSEVEIAIAIMEMIPV